MFTRHREDGLTTMAQGIERKTLVYGEKTLMSKFYLQQGCTLPRHSHPHEQTGYLLSGRLVLKIQERTFEAGPGDSWSIAGGLEHSVEVLEDAVVIEVFSPIRNDFLS